MPKNPHADFTPALEGYSGQGKFRFWCQMALPLTYDDSLSYYELLCKVVNYLNHTIEDVANAETNVSRLAEAYTQLQTYVNDYFDNLDVEAELRNVLDAMAEDGTLDDLLDPLVQDHLPAVVDEQIDDVVADQIDDAVAGQIDDVVAEQLPPLVEEGIPGEVSDWLTENVDPVGSAVVVDSSLTISGAAADAKVTGDEVTDLKTQLNNAKNLGGLDWKIGTLVPETGIESSSTTRIRSPYIPVLGGEIVELSGTANCLIVYCYNTDRGFISASAWTDGNRFNVPSGTGNIRILIRKDATNPTISSDEIETLAERCTLHRVLPGNVYDFDLEIDKIENEINKRPLKEYFNRFDPSRITNERYLSTTTGELTPGSQFFTSDFIEIGDLSTVKCSYTHIICWYDSNKMFINSPSQMNSINNDITLTPPSNAAYLRFSTYNEYLNTAQVGKDITRNLYIQYGYYEQPGLVITKDNTERIITVAADGSGNYTSLTKALYDNVDNGIDIIVKAGTYNIVSEYVALFGQSAVDSMADSDSAIFNGFQYGAIIRNRKIEFVPGAKVVCDWTGHTVDGAHRFSALRVDYNCEIIGLYLDCTATFYCIHDDYGLGNAFYTVKYENCHVVGHNIYNANCIGGGCKKYSKHILKNCYFNNNLTGQYNATVRYHNTNAADAEPEIYVYNCYFSNSFQPRYYGTQTTKMKVYVNNCEARAIFKMAESSSFDVDNVELYKWCNTETNPVNP